MPEPPQNTPLLTESEPGRPGHIVVGMSGGVDSSVAALLLRDGGFRVTGLFMKNWEEDDSDQYCAAADDLADAQVVCDRIGIPLRTINFSHEYWERVFREFLAEYRCGRTPNPDVLCNREIKFKEFLDHAKALGGDRIATGHYAGVDRLDGRYRLLRGRDRSKDQSYFLYALGQRALANSLFPLASLTKSQVRDIARKAGLAVHDKRDSTGICFIGERRFDEFLRRYIEPHPGEVRDPAGRVVGQHNGLTYYTIGQRHGLGIGGSGEPWYVAAKDPDRNVLYAVQGHEHPALHSEWLIAEHVNWISGQQPALPLRCRAKIRYQQDDQPCVVESVGEDTLCVRFEQSQRAVTPGQAVVLYQDEVCLGGATIVTCAALQRFEPAPSRLTRVFGK